jgi:hypothetical protein
VPKHRRVGEYQLGRIISEGQNFQDWEARHGSIESVRRRIRIYTFASAVAESEGLRTGFRRKPDSIPMIADSR